MKKVLFCAAIAILAASSVFAFTATEWDGMYSDLSPYISDYAGNGFSVSFPDSEGYLPTFFYTESVDGWVYDRNEPIYTVYTGFENLYTTDGFTLYSDEKAVTLDVMFMSSESQSYWGYAKYGKLWAGAGEYAFTPDDLFEFYVYPSGWDGVNNVVSYISTGIVADGYFGSGTPYMYLGGDGTFRFGREETVVPDPAACAYGVLGLVSVFGIKRRLRK